MRRCMIFQSIHPNATKTGVGIRKWRLDVTLAFCGVYTLEQRWLSGSIMDVACDVTHVEEDQEDNTYGAYIHAPKSWPPL